MELKYEMLKDHVTTTDKSRAVWSESLRAEQSQICCWIVDGKSCINTDFLCSWHEREHGYPGTFEWRMICRNKSISTLRWNPHRNRNLFALLLLRGYWLVASLSRAEVQMATDLVFPLCAAWSELALMEHVHFHGVCCSNVRWSR